MTRPLALFALAVAAAPAFAQDRYFLVLYGAQGTPYRTSETHTWATVARVGPAGVRADTISWLPATLHIRPLALRTEPGVDLPLADTFAWVAGWGGRVSVWGPFEIDGERYARLVARKAELDGGAVSYRALGSFSRADPSVSNCGQSFTRPLPEVGWRYVQPTPLPGFNGTSLLAERLVRSGTIPDPGADHGWLLPLVGVDPAAVTRRQPGERVPRR